MLGVLGARELEGSLPSAQCVGGEHGLDERVGVIGPDRDNGQAG